MSPRTVDLLPTVIPLREFSGHVQRVFMRAIVGRVFRFLLLGDIFRSP